MFSNLYIFINSQKIENTEVQKRELKRTHTVLKKLGVMCKCNDFDELIELLLERKLALGQDEIKKLEI
ncbi:hypothetical protein I6L25_09455 [Acinetobacter nosocomialis]|uniref:hypothetical protein n=1 Tax=Acinetobacter nosocomialis TaxID=106654 RepID=UPI0002D08489|nr:hypothetical protein [Acinetobacter nosocomialis]ENU47266.1 hypothetical protein F984_01635 [Acinetobacter nosocomialis NIPH 2119]QXC10663.1 hypothetical protein I6L25_09455 [Acinetobacter nosocomialis]